MLFKIAEALLTYKSMTNDQLQKICYFAYAWYLTFFGKRLFPEGFEAWEKGPVCPELYDKYKAYGRNKVPQSVQEIFEVLADEELEEFLGAVYDAYGELKEEELLYLACSEEPWLAAWKRLENGDSSTYCDEDIIDYYTRKVLKELNRENTGPVYKV